MTRLIVCAIIFIVCYLELSAGKAFPQNPKPAMPAPPVSQSTATVDLKASSKNPTTASPQKNANSPSQSTGTKPTNPPTDKVIQKTSVHPIHQKESIAKAITAPPETTRNPSDKPKHKETTAKAITAKPKSTSKMYPKESVAKAVTPPAKKTDNSKVNTITENPSKSGNTSAKPAENTSKPSNDQIKTSSASPAV